MFALQAPAEPTVAPELAVVGLVLVVATIAFVPVVSLVAHRIFPGRNVVFARWGFSQAAVVALVLVAATFISAFLPWVGEAAGAEELEASPSLLMALLRGTLIQGAACAAAIYFVARRHPDGIAGIGLWRGRHLRGVLTGVLCYPLVLPGLLGLGLVWPWVLETVGLGFEPQPYFEAFASSTGGERIAAVVLAVAVLPLLEETLFRGFLQPLLVQNFSDRGGIALTSLVFAWLHGPSAFLPVFGLSLLLGSLMLRTQRLSAVWAVHALHNGLMLALFLWLGENPVTG